MGAVINFKTRHEVPPPPKREAIFRVWTLPGCIQAKVASLDIEEIMEGLNDLFMGSMEDLRVRYPRSYQVIVEMDEGPFFGVGITQLINLGWKISLKIEGADFWFEIKGLD